MLFKTVHGSHLYGLADDNSDLDYYVVVATKNRRRKHYAKQTIEDGVDTMTVDLGTWLAYCNAGIPQALEAMFSREPLVDHLTAFRSSYRVNTAAMVNTYRRTAFNFLEKDTFKMRRHALRLVVNLYDGLRYGRFDPRLTQIRAYFISEIATDQARTEFAVNRLLEI